ncbi:triosephosphate isomerase, cytosolic-like [Papaver somniferum]|uniref:triosephosphate isomerase, cytosolic-like n=1 Tax=Papaver somniferum TaxID=3469 RepID=UPI000E6FE4E6|nr:triosephosphate isomerase, cytosolic-like [Papaver somniferum]
MNFVCVLADYNAFVCVSADFSSGGAFGVSVFEAAVKHENKVQKISRLDFIFHYLSVSAFVCLSSVLVYKRSCVVEVQVLEEDEKVVVVASSGSCVSVESIEMLSSLNIPWVILNLFERSAMLNESNELFRKKVAYALSQGFKVIDGVSETLE